MFRRRTVYTFLCLLATILLGTVIVLSSITYYLAIDQQAYITEQELDAPLDGSRWNASEHGKVERIPRILHQTWKSETLPPKWVNVSQGCRDMMPDYEYMLWTDASSREFIAEKYPWFLDTFDGYKYPIQRADVIRYFILHHFGGVYMDLDIGCVRPIDPLLTYPVILPVTNPVGISNDLIFAEPNHPFMTQTIHNLMSFDHNWILNYPTVMFTTGPMFLSVQYGMYNSAHPPTPDLPGGEIRVLPRSLYGKNAKPEDVPHSFFSHYYGSSWHADDAAFIGFLGKWGKILMWIGLGVLIVGLIRMALAPHSKKRKYSLRRIGGYEVVMPRWRTQHGRWHLDLGWFSLPTSGPSTQSSSPVTLSDDEDEVQLLPLPLGGRPLSPSSDISYADSVIPPPPSQGFGGALKRAGNSIRAYFMGTSDYSAVPRRSRRSRGVLFFLPAFFSPSQGVELPTDRHLSRSRSPPPLNLPISPYPPDKASSPDEYEATHLLPVSDSRPHSRAGSSSYSESTVC